MRIFVVCTRYYKRSRVPMGAITRIRQLSPYFLAVIAVVFIAFMVIQDSSCTSIRQQQQNPELVAIAEVNGEMISQAEYERRVRDYLERLRQQNAQMEAQGQKPQEIDDAQVRQQIFDQMVEEVLRNQEAKKLGLTVTSDELVDVILINPPQELQFFKDSTGKFQKELYQELVSNPARYGEILMEQGAPQEQVEKQQKLWNETLLDIERNMRTMKLQEALASAVNAAGSIPSLAWAEQDYKTNNSTADIRFVALSVDAISDSAVQLSDAELKAYYEKTKQFYTQKPARKLKYVVYRQEPSSKDSARAQRQSNELMQLFASETDIVRRDSIFSAKMNELAGISHDFTLISELDPTVSMILQTTDERDVFGPLNTPEGIKYYRVDGRREGQTPMVRASHILVTFDNNKDSALALAKSLLAKAIKGEDFGTLAMINSRDPGSAQQRGDLGYFGKGKMVPEFEKAAFDANVGDIVGPVETQFGYHIIKVTDKQSLEIKYSEISLVPRMSTATKQSMVASALKIETEVLDGAPFDSVAKKMNLPVLETRFFGSRSPTLGSSELTAWAFSAKIGDVRRIDVDRLGLVVAQLTEIRQKGLKPFEDVKEEIERTLRVQKKLDMLKAKADQVASACKNANSLDAAASVDPTLTVRVQTALRNNGQLSGFGGDFASTNAAFTQPIGEVGSPVRGKRAWVVMIVDSRNNADMAAFQKDKVAHLQNFSARNRQSVYYTWFQNLKEHSEIVDKRWFRD